MNYINMVQFVHSAVSEVVNSGDLVVDATVGNGHDTIFLAGLVGRQGTVIGFDIQQEALDTTRIHLEKSGLIDRVLLVCQSHDRLVENVSKPVSCVMFNLGYLPGSDRQLITKSDTTISALRQSLDLVAGGGLVSVVVYREHAGGNDEAEEVERLFCGLDNDRFLCSHYTLVNTKRPAPEVWLAFKR